MEKSVFIPERQAVVNAQDTETADSVVYKFDTQIAGMAPNNYFAMQKIDEDKQEQFIKSEVIAPLFSKVKDRKSKISAPFVSALEATRQYDENLSTVAGGETQNKDYVVPFVKGAARGVSDFVVDTVAGAYYEGQDFGAGLAAWQTGDEVNTDITPELQQSIAQFNHLKDKYYQKFGLTLDENDSEVAANLGATVSSLGLSVGAFWALKNPYAAMTLFGANSQASSYMELRQKGVKPLEAFAVSTALGTATGVLEKWGVQNLLSAWATRRFRSAVFKNSVSKYAVPYLKAAAAEGVTEASQSGAESLYMYPYRDDRAEQILNDMVQSGFYGSVGGILGLGGLQIATRKKRASYKQVLVDTLGYEPSYAQELVDAAYLDDETAQKELKEIIDNEVISVLENDQADKMMQETLDQGKALYEKIAEQKAAGLSDALMARVDEIGKNIEEEAIAAGVDEKEAKAAASLSSAMIRGVARAAEEQGLDVDQVIEQSLVKIENRPESQKFVDENMQEVEVDFEPEEDLNLSIEPMSAEQIQDEVDAERIALMVEDGQMSEAEATFRVKTGREPTETDKMLGYDFIPYQLGEALTERENGYAIAGDNETVEAVVIPENAVPDFKSRAELRDWLVSKFREVGNITILSTGAKVEFNNTAAKRVVKNARNRTNNIAYPEIEKVVSSAKYSGFKSADERHPNVKGQDVYHSGVMYKGQPYSVEFYVDVPLDGNIGDNFAGNKVNKIKVEPQRYGFKAVAKEDETSKGSTYKISLAVLRGKVNPARYSEASNTLYQLGEPKSLPVKISGKEFGEYTGDRKTYGKAFAKYYKDNIAGKSVISPVLGEVKFFNSAIDETKHWNKLTPENLKYIAAVPEIIATSRDVTEEAPKHTRKDDIVTFYRVRGNVDINGNVKNIAVVIAEDRYGNKYYSLDAKEKSSLTDTAVNGQALGELRSISAYDNSMPQNGDGVNDIDAQVNEKTLQTDPATNPGVGGLASDSSEYIYSMPQNGDGVNDTLYQTSDERLAQNYKNINKVQNSGLVYPVLGQYEPASKVITLFKGRNPTTLTHELLHHYLPIYLNMMEQGGKIDDLKGLYQELGVDSVQRMQRQHWEKLVDMGTAYFYHKKAPNQSSQTIFEYAKSWAIDVYETVKRFIKPSDEVTKFFEKLISDEEIPDINRLKGKTKELAKILAGARNGQELTIDGVSLRDVAALRRALHARVPAKGVNLATLIRQAGGLDADAQFAKQLGFDAKKGYEGGFWRKDGAIKNEQSLIEFLKDNGFLADIDTKSYEETSDLWNKVEDLIYNKDDAYNFNEAGKNARRENAVLARDMVEQLLRDVYDKDIDLLDQDLKAATKLLAEHGAVAVDKATLEYLNYSVKKLGKDYQKLLYQKKEERYAYQQKLTDFIKDLPNNFKDKAKFMDKIRMVKDERTFNKYLTEIKNRAEEYLKSEQKRLYADLIQKEVKSSRPRKLKMQKYDYENNTLFRDLREYNKLTADAAALKLATLPEDSLDEARALRLRRMFLQYKANGVKSSPELLQQLYEEIASAKEQGRMAKEENDFIKGFERREQREKLLEILDNSEADKNLKSTQALNAYRRGISNLYTMLNSLFGKDVADKYEFETVLDRKETKEWKHLKKINKRTMQIYKLKDYGDLLNTMADKGQIVTTLYRKEQSQLPDVENYDEKMRYDLSLLDIMDIYNAVKNKKSREDYYRVYGQAQVNKTLELLLPEDRAFADMLMEDVNSYFDEINKIYIKTYGIDLPKVENYWMSTASHLENQDMFGTVTAATSNVPSFMKERSAGAVVPLPKSAWIKYQKHIAQTYYMLEVAEKWADLSKMFSSEEMKNRIENHFGEKVYDNLKRQIDSIGLNAQTPSVDDVSGVFNSMVNGWVGAKIALNPVVFVGQLTSFTNYVEGVDAKQWLKNTLYAMRHPLEVKDFMMQHHGDFLMHRFESGFNEAMNRFIKEASSSQKSRFGLSPKARKSYSDVLSSFVRIGDLGAIIYGGYGQYKTMLDNGMSEAEAKKKFEFNTLRSQQSGNAASISLWQQNKGIARLFLSFKNTSLQYTRKIIDTVMMAKRGDMSMAEARKVLLNYVIIQPALWMVAKNIAKAILQLDDDDDKITDGVLEQVLVNPIESIPVVSDLVKAGMKAATDQPVYSVFSMPLLDDVEKSLRRAKKDDKTVYDYVDVVAPFIEMTTTLPVATAKRYIKTWSEKWEN